TRPEEKPTPAPVQRSMSVAIPTPEECNVAPAGQPARAVQTPRAEPLDWSVTSRRLAELGVERYNLESLGAGRARFSCWVSQGGAAQLVQGDGASPAEAVQVCLDRARQHLSQKR